MRQNWSEIWHRQSCRSSPITRHRESGSGQYAVFILWEKIRQDQRISLGRWWFSSALQETCKWFVPVAAECFGSPSSDASGIPVAYGRSFHRSAQSNQRHRQKKRFLILCAKQRILNFLYPWQQTAARHLSTAFFFPFECDVDETQKNICFKTAGGYLS